MSVGSSGVKVGVVCFYVMGGIYCVGMFEEVIISYIINKMMYIDFMLIIMIVEFVGISVYILGCRYYFVNIVGYCVGDMVMIWINFLFYFIYIQIVMIDCFGNFVQNGMVCVFGQLVKFVLSIMMDMVILF